MSRVILTAAMPAEAELLSARLTPCEEVGARPAFSGKLGGREVLLLLTGMGLVNAAQAATAALSQAGSPACLINLGCAGAYASGPGLGQAALATALVFADQGVLSSKQFYGLDKINIPLLKDAEGRPLFNTMPVDSDLTDEIHRAAPWLKKGVFATVGQVSGDVERAEALSLRWDAAIEEMEGAAVAQVAAWYGLPFAAVRGISNRAGRRQLDLPAGAEAAQRAVLAWLGES